MITTQQISLKIAKAIKDSGKTQTGLAKEIGVCQQVISAYINGTKLPALDTLANLCVVLDLDANEILCIK